MDKRIEAFCKQCETLTAEQIYELFEDETPDDLRDAIYASSGVTYPETPEPFRAACIYLGEKYNIQSLKDY